ncbi:phosphotransferase [Anaerobacillus sp. CMMVII]|uniref:aminoglycoside phosphotransferase family protein n=1 Tax=Anaerobacillus sp. CMMVII TaxID=2755588 RepID=UPI0021B84085|nr:phosphotransferase [Anaerobacillus sp. CMMVII]MCT8138273.1 phosphotransferase [Anaerobacillus sp. CMMVII]
MIEKILTKIPYLSNAKTIEELTKGFSFDKKYVVDHQYLLRIFSNREEARRTEEFTCLGQLAAYSKCVPRAIDFGRVEGTENCYMLLEFLPGEDAETILPRLPKEEQYVVGFQAGRELKKLHQLAAPKTMQDWYTLKKRKSDNYLHELENVPCDIGLKYLLKDYIKEHEHLMKNRPSSFQHDDFHPANLLIHNNQFSGIIDFQRMDWGDPLHDLTKLGFFSKRISIDFTNGVVDGYHEDKKVSTSFWELYALYSAMHVVSSLVWGLKMSQEQYDVLLEYSLEVLADHDQFNQIIPKWYRKEN